MDMLVLAVSLNLLFEVFASIVSPQVQNSDNSVLTVVSP